MIIVRNVIVFSLSEFENDEDTDSSVADEHCMLFIMDEKGGIIATDLCRDKSGKTKYIREHWYGIKLPV